MTHNGWYEPGSRFFACSSWHTSTSPQSTYESEFDTPHMIVTYTALISLAILRDDFTRLDRRGLVTFLRSSQREDGRSVLGPFEVGLANQVKSFTSDPTGGDTDLRLTYCAFVICTLLNDWSGLNVEKALEFVKGCRVSSPCRIFRLRLLVLDVRRWLRCRAGMRSARFG